MSKEQEVYNSYVKHLESLEEEKQDIKDGIECLEAARSEVSKRIFKITLDIARYKSRNPEVEGRIVKIGYSG